MSSLDGIPEITRSVNGAKSLQARLDKDHFILNVLAMYKQAFLDSTPPAYGDQQRAEWLINFVRGDSILSGITNSVVQIDRNRGWALTGGRNQVLRFEPVFTQADENEGWRFFCGRAASDFYQTDMGTVVELGRLGPGGPLAAMWNVDATKCSLTGQIKTPLRYSGGGKVEWERDDFFRVVPMPSNEEKYKGLGFCGVSRALELSRIMVGILRHAQEKLASRAKKGFLSIYPMSDAKWEEIEDDMDKKAENEGRRVYEDVIVLTSEDDEIKISLTGLSQLPDNFTIDEWIQTLVSGYSLCFGYDVGEFWSPRSSGFSRGAEAEVQSAKATGKGERDFSLGMQERIQLELPPTLSWEFDQRDDRAEMLIAELHEKRAKIAALLYGSGGGSAGNTDNTDRAVRRAVDEDEEGDKEAAEDTQDSQSPKQPQAQPKPKEGILSRDEARQYLVDYGVISQELTALTEDLTITDIKTVRERVREQSFIHRCAERWPREPIVRYEWPTGKERVIFDEADEAIRPRVWRGHGYRNPPDHVYTNRSVDLNVIHRDAESGDTVYSKNGLKITTGDIDLAVEEADDDLKDFLLAKLEDAEEQDD